MTGKKKVFFFFPDTTKPWYRRLVKTISIVFHSTLRHRHFSGSLLSGHTLQWVRFFLSFILSRNLRNRLSFLFFFFFFSPNTSALQLQILQYYTIERSCYFKTIHTDTEISKETLWIFCFNTYITRKKSTITGMQLRLR